MGSYGIKRDYFRYKLLKKRFKALIKKIKKGFILYLKIWIVAV
jgi:hypothetical protein